MPIESMSIQVWHGNNFYRPDMAKKVTLILTTYLNYCDIGEYNYVTPAEKLGIAKGPVRLKDILDY